MTDLTPAQKRRNAIVWANVELDRIAVFPSNWDGYGSSAPAQEAITTARKWAAVWTAWGLVPYASPDGGIILESEPDFISIDPGGSCAAFDSLTEGIQISDSHFIMIGDRVATRRPYHSVSITEDGWTIEHPPECPDLFGCPLTAAAQQWGRRPVVDGVYRMNDDGSLSEVTEPFDFDVEGVYRQIKRMPEHD